MYNEEQSAIADRPVAAPLTGEQVPVPEDGQASAEAYRLRLERLETDFDDFRKRKRSELATAQTDAEDELLVEFFDVLDSLELGLHTAREADVPDGFLQGFELVYRQAMGVLRGKGVERLETVGRSFDPALHDCLGRVTEGSGRRDTVAREVRAGYVRGDKVLRPAQVLIGARPEPNASENSDAAVTHVKVTTR